MVTKSDPTVSKQSSVVESVLQIGIAPALYCSLLLFACAAFPKGTQYDSVVTEDTVVASLNTKETRIVFRSTSEPRITKALILLEGLEHVELHDSALSNTVVDALATHRSSLSSVVIASKSTPLSSSVITNLLRSTRPESLVLNVKLQNVGQVPEEPLLCESVVNLTTDDWSLFRYVSFPGLEALTVTSSIDSSLTGVSIKEWSLRFPTLSEVSLDGFDPTLKDLDFASELPSLLFLSISWRKKPELEVTKEVDSALGRISNRIRCLALGNAPGNAESLWRGIADTTTMTDFELRNADAELSYYKAIAANTSLLRVGLANLNETYEFVTATSKGRGPLGFRHYHLPNFMDSAALGQLDSERLREISLSGCTFNVSSTDELQRIFQLQPAHELALSPALKVGRDGEVMHWMDEGFVEVLVRGLKSWLPLDRLSITHWYGTRPLYLDDVLAEGSAISHLSLPYLAVPDQAAIAKYRVLLANLKSLHVRSVSERRSWELISSLDTLETLALESTNASVLHGAFPNWPAIRTLAVNVGGETGKISSGMDYVLSMAIGQKSLSTLALGSAEPGHGVSSFALKPTASKIERFVYCEGMPKGEQLSTILKLLPELRLLEYDYDGNPHFDKSLRETANLNPSLAVVDHPHAWSLNELLVVEKAR
jgi:hypothetical protein